MGLHADTVVFANVREPSRTPRVWPMASVMLPLPQHFKTRPGGPVPEFVPRS